MTNKSVNIGDLIDVHGDGSIIGIVINITPILDKDRRDGKRGDTFEIVVQGYDNYYGYVCGKEVIIKSGYKEIYG